jgi:aminotransferase
MGPARRGAHAMTRTRSHRLEGLAQSEIRRMTRECERLGGINLGQGICDVAMPDVVRERAEAAMRAGANQYSKPEGILELREAIAAKLRRDNGIEANPGTEIVVTAGLTGAYVSTVLGLLDPGDGILVFEPYYGYHVNIALGAGLRPQFVRSETPHAPLTEASLRSAIDDGTRALVVCTPSNPSGKVYDRAELELIARIAHERDLLVITDEIYEYFVYDGGKHVSPATIGGLWPRTVSLMGYSKTFAITGWRIGYAVASEPLARSVLLANDLDFICAPRPAQHGVAAGIAELEPAWYHELSVRFEHKRDRLAAALAEAGFAPLVPQGAYYVFADIRPLGYRSAQAAAMDLLERAGVATVPGTAFYDSAEDAHWLRVCFAKEDDVLDDACARIAHFEA